MKRYEWRCDCGVFTTQTRDQPAPCPACGAAVRRVWSAKPLYHPTASSKSK